MSYQVLARKWRPKRFEDVVGQVHVTRSLQNSLGLEKLAHAYLFTGTRGVGKTSIARLFGKAIRCENRGVDLNPCLECISCKDIEAGNSLDYQEIDGASNNSVDNVRELIENVRYLPARGTHKIYVIDEVHMLSTAAFNALLKTLEEPPAHVIFLFATTEAHKLLGTILSRCQRFDFKSVPVETLSSHLKMIIESEQIKFTDTALINRLASYGKGSVRDALSLLDQVLSLAGEGTIDETVFFQSLGLARAESIRDLLGYIVNEKPLEASSLFQQLLQENIDLKRIIDQMLEAFYEVIQQIDTPNDIYAKDLLPADALTGVTFAELFWIYETFIKDCEWALQSPGPDKVVDLVLQKLARRRQILQPDRALIPSGPSVTTPVKKKESSINTMKLKIANPSFEALVSHMGNDAIAIRGNLAMGNFIESPRLTDDGVSLVLGFHKKDTMPREYLQDPEVMPKFRSKVADHFGVSSDKTQIKIVAVEEEEAVEMGFVGLAENDEKKHQAQINEKREKLLNDPYVKEAEKLFGAKVDKVVLKDER